MKENGRVGVKPPITIHIIPTGKQQLFTLSPLCQQLLFSIYIISTAITITQFTLSTLQTIYIISTANNAKDLTSDH